MAPVTTSEETKDIVRIVSEKLGPEHLPLLAAAIPKPIIDGLFLAISDSREIQTVKDETDYQLATDCAGRESGIIAAIEDYYKPYKKGSDQLHDRIVAMCKEAVAPHQAEKDRLKKIGTDWFVSEQKRQREEAARRQREIEERERAERAERDRIAQEAAAKAEEEARQLRESAAAAQNAHEAEYLRLEAERAQAEASQIIEDRAQESEVEALSPQLIIPPVPAPRAAGSSIKTEYSIEITDLHAFIIAAAANWNAYGHLCLINEKSVLAQVKACKGKIEIPGVKINTRATMSVTKRS